MHNPELAVCCFNSVAFRSAKVALLSQSERRPKLRLGTNCGLNQQTARAMRLTQQHVSQSWPRRVYEKNSDEEADELLGACGSGGAARRDFRHDGAGPHRPLIITRQEIRKAFSPLRSLPPWGADQWNHSSMWTSRNGGQVPIPGDGW